MAENDAGAKSWYKYVQTTMLGAVLLPLMCYYLTFSACPSYPTSLNYLTPEPLAV